MSLLRLVKPSCQDIGDVKEFKLSTLSSLLSDEELTLQFPTNRKQLRRLRRILTRKPTPTPISTI